MDTMTPTTVEQLIADCLQLHYPVFYRLAYSYVRNEQDAMDIVQESVYKAMKHCHDLQEPQYVRTWLYQIVRNESISFLRKNKYTSVPLIWADGEQEDYYPDVDLQLAIKQLNCGERMVVILRFFEGLSFQQMAERLQENINTIKSRLYRALQKLRIFIEEPTVIL